MRNETEKLTVNVGGARNSARKLLKDVAIKEIPVSLWQVIQYLKTQYDLEVIRVPLGAAIDGLIIRIGEQPTIGFNGDKSWVRRRFTIAHEIGHLMLGHTLDCGADTNSEAEADQFAAELLMPLKFLKIHYKDDPDLQRLAEKYIVSREALCYHLMDCRMV